MTTTKSNRSFLLGFLFLLVGAVWGQEEHHQQPQCDCVDLNARHDKCVDDWRALDQLRQVLEAQVRDTGRQAEERCQAHVEEVRNELGGQIEQARAEGNSAVENERNENERRMTLVRQESQSQLEQVQNESHAQAAAAEQARSELTQCQSQHTDLTAKMEEASNAKQQLETASKNLENELQTTNAAKAELEQAKANLEVEKAKLESDKRKLEKSLSDRSLDLEKAKKEQKSVKAELSETKKTLDDMIAAKTIIMIEWDLLNEKIEEIKQLIMESVHTFLNWVGGHLGFVKAEGIKFWKMLETEVFPEVKRVVENDVIPFVKKTWKDAIEFWEELYAPYRGPVNKQIKEAKKEWRKFYKANLESHVKEYQLDKHYETSRETAIEYMTLAHEKLVEGVETSSSVALKFAKVEKFPPFIIEQLQTVNSNIETTAFAIECFIAFVVVRIILGILFRKKKKPKKPKMTKKQWEAKQQAEKAKAKQQQQAPKNKATKNGTKNHKKTK